MLAEMFLQRFNLKYNESKVLSPEVKEWMFAYSWPGNVREVQNMIERLAIISNEKTIKLKDLPCSQRDKVPGFGQDTQRLSLKEKNKELEKRLLKSVVSSGKSSRDAAKELGISQTTFLRKVRQYGIVR
jgi:TyrR family helix-turn-helix protein